MSFLLFMYVRYQKEYTKDYITKVEIRNIPSKSLIVNNIPDTITITLKGFKDNIYELPTEFSAYIDLTNAKVGSNIYDIYLDGNIDYSKMNITVNPNKIPIILDELSYKTVPIVVPAISNTSLGLKIDDIIINPSNATIYGPKSLLSTVEEIKTHNLDLTNVCLDYSTTSKLNLPKNIKSDISKVNIDIIFNKDTKIIEFNDIFINIDNLNSKFNIKSDNAFIVNKIILETSETLITNINRDNIFLYFNLKNITNSGIYSNVIVEANIPTYTKLIKIEPSFFDVEIIDRKISNDSNDYSEKLTDIEQANSNQ